MHDAVGEPLRTACNPAPFGLDGEVQFAAFVQLPPLAACQITGCTGIAAQCAAISLGDNARLYTIAALKIASG